VDDGRDRVDDAVIVLGGAGDDAFDRGLVVSLFTVGVREQFRDEAADEPVSVRVRLHQPSKLDDVAVLRSVSE
jgi:hypothetical protein